MLFGLTENSLVVNGNDLLIAHNLQPLGFGFSKSYGAVVSHILPHLLCRSFIGV